MVGNPSPCAIHLPCIIKRRHVINNTYCISPRDTPWAHTLVPGVERNTNAYQSRDQDNDRQHEDDSLPGCWLAQWPPMVFQYLGGHVSDSAVANLTPMMPLGNLLPMGLYIPPGNHNAHVQRTRFLSLRATMDNLMGCVTQFGN